MTKPNILYIHSHDTGRYTQPYGYPVPTPRIQALAEEGIVFRQAFCAAPTCSPSRAALLTGRWAHNTGMLGLVHRGFALSDPRQHLAHTLKEAGYTTALAGVQHVASGDALDTLGYDYVRPNDAKRPEQTAAALLHDLNEPFFLDVGFEETHRIGRGFSREHDEPGDGDADGRWFRPPSPLPDTPETRQDMADYATAATRLDSKYGVILDALAASGKAENTLVVCTTDHGIAFPRMKCSLTDHGIGVQLIVRGPHGFSGGRTVDALVSQIDLYPTLCDLAGIARPDWLQGVSLLPLLDGAAEVRDEVFAEVTFHAAFEPKRCVRTKRWKYIRNYDPRRHPVLPNCDDSPSKDVLLAAGWRDRSVPEEELFDLTFDPNETNNVAGDARYAGTLAQMRERLDRWMANTDDPLLADPLPVPSTLKVNDADGVSPNEPAGAWSADKEWRPPVGT